MHHFFADPQNINLENNTIHILGEDVKHIQKSLRLKEKEKISVADGSGKGYLTQITSLENDLVVVRIIEEMSSQEKLNATRTLYQGIAKGSKMDFIIQKSVELGIDNIIPVITEYTVVQLKEKDTDKKRQRWQKIAEEAAKQCKRFALPTVYPPVSYAKAVSEHIDQNDGSLHFLAYELESDTSVKKLLSEISIEKYSNFGIWIGPEGGFDDHEIKLALDAGVNIVGLGPRILRTETAGIVLLSILLYEMEI
ncbi:MAG: 16S rRNA (uracil(1498)-N(3))-methyltransferase [Tindallia sp. MSAO_Bac2]|nr:MAG: 16S rRNA (uracil(1498)-N(3))-methyltransferase [Tindallia sp. MSAO_Bac2]